MKLEASKSLGLYVQKQLGKTGIEFHWPEYQYIGPSNHLKTETQRPRQSFGTDAKENDTHNSRAENLRNKHAADQKMIEPIDLFVVRKNMTERTEKGIMQAKTRLNLKETFDCVQQLEKSALYHLLFF